MTIRLFVGALALGIALVPATAMADDPRDPAMRSAEARARDRAIIKRLNQEQLAYVQNRDAHYAEGWRAYREGDREGPRVAPARAAQYDHAMAAWRRAVAKCNAGYYEYCAR